MSSVHRTPSTSNTSLAAALASVAYDLAISVAADAGVRRGLAHRARALLLGRGAPKAARRRRSRGRYARRGGAR